MVFEDPSGIRWKKFLFICTGICLVGLILILGFVFSVVVKPQLHRVPRLSSPDGNGYRIIESELASADAPKEPATTAPADSEPATQPAVQHPLSQPAFFKKPFLHVAFLIQDDPASVASLKNNIQRLDIVVPDWYTLSTADGKLHETVKPQVTQLLTHGKVQLFPRLANVDVEGVWHADEFSELLRDEDARTILIQTLVDKILQSHAQGINLDIEALSSEDRDLYLDWMADLVAAFHRHNLYVTVDLPLNDEAFDYETIGKIADAVIVMGYDEHFPGGQPGPIASQEWFVDGIETMAHRIPPEKIIVGLGAYGYDWKVGDNRETQSLTFIDAMRLAASVGAKVKTESVSVNTHFSYKAQDGSQHDVWLLDAISFWNQFLTVKKGSFGGIGLWRLGQEEPGVWDILACDSPADFQPSDLETVKSQQTILSEGEGELLKVDSLRRDGNRDVSVDGQTIDWAGYGELPRYFTVKEMGHSTDRKVALTFDDGPNPEWTPQVLEVLRRNNVRATFFLIGERASETPDLVKQEAAEGHLLGNHTFSHPDIQAISDVRLNLELTATQRIIESCTGRETLLFRPPFGLSSPLEPDEVTRLYAVCKKGYLIAGADIDPADYAQPGADVIVQRVIDTLKISGSSVVLMHDGGGNRSQTVQALTILIPRLKKEGYRFVTLNELLGLPRKSLMPSAPLRERVLAMGGRIPSTVTKLWWPFLKWLFLVTTAVSIFRILLLGFFVIRRRSQQRTADYTPPVTVLIPAYNESKVIRRTLEAVCDSDYPTFTVLVVDDGSTDDTAAIVQEMAQSDNRISLISRPNGGKHSALNLGFQTAKDDYVVTLDADTIVSRQTLRHLIAPFADPKVDAVCGNVNVGNTQNLLTLFQNVEYVTSQNYDRRAFEALNSISVVPGATGAWRRQTVSRVGGYSGGTLTEDADLTLTVLEYGGRIAYAPLARSKTEAPESTSALFRQRFRWSYGTFQCLWKHRKSFGRGSLGWVALPNILVFQLIFPLFAPIGDLVLLISFFRRDFTAILVGYLLFLALDLCGSLFAFLLDGKKLRHLWVILIQRFYYRQFMYVVAWRSSFAAIKGLRQKWHKLDRQASIDGVRGALPATVGLAEARST